MKETKLGKITKAEFGLGGYQDVQFGFSVVLEGRDWGTCSFSGFWADEPSDNSTWNIQDQDGYWGEMIRELHTILLLAGVSNVNELVGKPVEVVFEGQKLVSWRILDEVL